MVGGCFGLSSNASGVGFRRFEPVGHLVVEFSFHSDPGEYRVVTFGVLARNMCVRRYGTRLRWGSTSEAGLKDAWSAGVGASCCLGRRSSTVFC